MPAALAYFDTSVLVKRYVKEVGSPLACSLLRRQRFLSSAIAPAEAMSAIRRRRAAGDLTEQHFVAILKRLERDRAHWELVEVTHAVLSRAESLIRETGLRTLDAIHLSSALTFHLAAGTRVPFVTADAAQRTAAEHLALDVIWVEGSAS